LKAGFLQALSLIDDIMHEMNTVKETQVETKENMKEILNVLGPVSFLKMVSAASLALTFSI